MKGANCLIKALEANGVDTVFGYPGGAIMPVYDALLDSNIRHILTRHEQGAALAAIGYARVSGKVGVCMATSGPGATNLLTGIADAFADSMPLVAITGQAPTPVMGTDAFQEVDVLGITMPVVKHSFLVRYASDISHVVNEAFRIASAGRPGPVVIDLPKDVANASGDFAPPVRPTFVSEPIARAEQIEQARELIERSSRPIVYAGGGVIAAGAVQELREFVDATGIPTVHTLKGLGALPADHELFLGMLGMHGLKNANLAVQGCDLLIVVGARFDDRVTGKTSEFAPHAKVIHLDVDPSEVGKIRRADVAVIGDLKSSLRRMHVRPRISHWRRECDELKRAHAWDYDAPIDGVYAPRMIRDLSLAADDNTYITCDVGQHQMWVAQHYRFKHPRQHLTSGGLGTMGFGLPAAIGAQLAIPEATVINVTGDGSIMMNIQELATIKRYGLPVKIVLFDNQALGMVRQWQELFFDKRYSEVDLSDNPDFVRVAEAFDIPALRVERGNEVAPAIERILTTKGPLFVHVPIDPAANVWPLVPPGKSNTEMLMESKA
jgi:acetolactate synthase-1/2/3 large subunit